MRSHPVCSLSWFGTYFVVLAALLPQRWDWLPLAFRLKESYTFFKMYLVDTKWLFVTSSRDTHKYNQPESPYFMLFLVFT